MCCCGQPTKNGEKGAYSWDGKTFSTYPVHPPALNDGDQLIYDLPGRCGGLDSHAHDLRLVRYYGRFDLLVNNGTGDHRIDLGVSFRLFADTLERMTDNERYWLLLSFYHATEDAKRATEERCNQAWRQAAADKRIKTRKLRNGNVRVTVLPRVVEVTS